VGSRSAGRSVRAALFLGFLPADRGSERVNMFLPVSWFCNVSG
jgi:hypothetical protein